MTEEANTKSAQITSDEPAPARVNVRRSRKQDETDLAAVKEGVSLTSDETTDDRGEDGTFRVRTVNGTEIATRVA